jgi:hypothetical protein
VKSHAAEHLHKDQAALTQQISEIETTCFRREPATSLDFSTLIGKWQKAAQVIKVVHPNP